VLDNVRSAYNVGAVLRTADAFRLEAVYLTGITCTGDHRSVHKTALGAQDSVPWTYRESAVELVRELKAAGRQIAALEITDAPTPLRSSNLLSYPLCLIIGNELTGVDPKLLAESDHALEIPQYGAKQSLNVAVAFGIAAYALVEEYHSREESHPGRTANRQRERKVL
jgi:tRNA G18 (ribose-2'-O)-methylase SpoU